VSTERHRTDEEEEMILRVDSYQQDGGDSTYRATAEGSDTQPYSSR